MIAKVAKGAVNRQKGRSLKKRRIQTNLARYIKSLRDALEIFIVLM